MAKSKMITCKHCGEEIAKSAKVCPHCGGKNKRRHPILVTIIVLFILFVIISASTSNSDNDDETEAANAEYTKITVHELNKTLKENAMLAEDYEDQYLEITGVICTKDSDGEYISLVCDESLCEYCAFNSILCYIKTEDQLAIIKPINTGAEITLKVKITDVGEVFGYTCDIIEIVE